jgi:hypothetical protein
MKKTILFSILAIFTLQANAQPSQPSIQDLIKEIQALRSEVASLKKNQKENHQAIEEVSDLAENTEARTFKNKIDFGLGFKTNLDNFTKKYADGHSVKSDNVWSNKLMLNMKADISKNMNFYGRLSMYKYWGSEIIHPYSYYDNMQGRVPSDSSLYVERAYINWFFNKEGHVPMALTIGRQPSSDGPSNQFKNNTTRKGTYSSLLYDGAADGIVWTANLSKVIDNPQSYLRLGYSKGYGYSETSGNVGNAFVGASNNDIKDTNVFGIFFDTTVPNVDNSLIQISYSHMADIVANPLDANTSVNTNIGSLDLYGAMIEFTNFKDTHLDMFAQFGYSIAHPNGNSYANYGGLLNAPGKNDDKEAYAAWVGGRYGFGKRQKYKIGAEYNHGSKNWINLTQGSFDIYNKLATRGDAYEIYLMYVINRYTNLRLGYVDIHYDYTRSGWFVGESEKINSSMKYANENIENLQSAYLKMNLLF